jgi:hypothetical protein
MSTILADAALSSTPARDASRTQRLPRALGLGLAALMTGALWCGVVAAFRFRF